MAESSKNERDWIQYSFLFSCRDVLSLFDITSRRPVAENKQGLYSSVNSVSHYWCFMSVLFVVLFVCLVLSYCYFPVFLFFFPSFFLSFSRTSFSSIFLLAFLFSFLATFLFFSLSLFPSSFFRLSFLFSLYSFSFFPFFYLSFFVLSFFRSFFLSLPFLFLLHHLFILMYQIWNPHPPKGWHGSWFFLVGSQPVT